jgi:hypothetical protein
VRLALSLLAALFAVTLVACGGDDDEAAAPLPLAQRFVTAEDAPGSKPDPLETRQTTDDFDEFMRALTDFSINPDQSEIAEVFKEADFESAGVDTRFFGEKHDRDDVHVASSATELRSEEGAARALDWSEADQLKPCPMSCAVQRSSFDVDDVSGGRGVHRLATAEAIERLGTEDEHPHESYWIGFTVGPVLYTVEVFGPPGSVSEDQVQEIASAYHERLTGG